MRTLDLARRLALIAFAVALPAAGGIGTSHRWYDPETGVDIATYPCAEDAARLCGRIVAVPPDGPQLDERNPDPVQRRRPLVGLEVLQAFEAAAPGRWEGGGQHGRLPGRIYVPANGDTLGDHRNRYQIVIDSETLTISIANCRLLDCIGKKVWRRRHDASSVSREPR